MAAKKAASLPLSAVFLEKEENKQQHGPADPRFLPSVREVIMWALFHAGLFVVDIACSLIVASNSRNSHPPSWLLRRDVAKPTDAEVNASLMAAMLWCVCVASQAATGALALALPRQEGRRRLLLAYAALVATTAGHCIWAGAYIMFVAPRLLSVWNGINTMVFFFIIVGDLLCFRGLVLRSVEGRSSEDSSLQGKEVEPAANYLP